MKNKFKKILDGAKKFKTDDEVRDYFFEQLEPVIDEITDEDMAEFDKELFADIKDLKEKIKKYKDKKSKK